jgi:hypothetical protein
VKRVLAWKTFAARNANKTTRSGNLPDTVLTSILPGNSSFLKRHERLPGALHRQPSLQHYDRMNFRLHFGMAGTVG